MALLTWENVAEPVVVPVPPPVPPPGVVPPVGVPEDGVVLAAPGVLFSVNPQPVRAVAKINVRVRIFKVFITISVGILNVDCKQARTLCL